MKYVCHTYSSTSQRVRHDMSISSLSNYVYLVKLKSWKSHNLVLDPVGSNWWLVCNKVISHLEKELGFVIISLAVSPA